MKKYLIIPFAIFGFLLSNCEKEKDFDNEVNVYSEKYEFLDARSYTDWVYFSFSENKIVEVTDFQNDLTWDIAFHRGDVRLNGGASGKGLAEAVNTNKTDFDAVLQAPSSSYKKDEVGTITVAFTGTGVEEEEQPFSQVVSGWLSIDTSNPPPVYTISNNVYVVKTANGNFVKLQLYDNKDATGKAGYVSFKYQINTDGGNSFK